MTPEAMEREEQFAPVRLDLPDLRRTVPVLLDHCLATHPDRPLLIADDERITYREAIARSAVLARQLLDAGVGKGTRIGMLFPNDPKFLVVWFAITRIGAVAVPVSTLSTAAELRRTARHADLHMLITAEKYLSHNYADRLETALEGITAQRAPFRLAAAPHLREVWIWGERVPAWAKPVDLSREPQTPEDILREIESEVHPGDTVSIIYTSGSTADPKGVIHSHGNFLRQGAKLASTYPYRAGDSVYTPMPFFWVGGLTLTILNLMHTGCTILGSAKTGGELLDFLERERMSFFFGWPHLARGTASHPSFAQRDFSFVKGGTMWEALPPEKRPKNHSFGDALGMTETCGSHTLSYIDHTPEFKGSMGPSMPGMQHRIIDIETGRPLPAGERGELQVRGDAALLGMVKRERHEVFDPDGWYGTKDLCSIRGGHLFFHGRVDDMIKSSGANVSPDEVQMALMAIPGVAQAFVSGVPDAQRGTVVGAVVVPRPGAAVTPEALRQEAAKSLSAYKVPRVIVLLEATKLPMMSSSKVDRRALLRLLTEAHG
jgi:acyl-CoA synthetase (AMP-forming)/AMP-acid ligase II